MLNKDTTHAGHLIKDFGNKGAYGVVHRAHRLVDGKEVALKVVTLDSKKPLDYIRFKLENVILHRLKPHDNIVSPFTHVANNGKLAHYTMEFIESDIQSLDDQLRLDNIPLNTKIKIAINICKGLQHAHDKKIYHRDLHPGNVRVKEPGFIPKLADFGLAKIIGSYLKSDTALLAGGSGVRPPEFKFFTKDSPNDKDYEVGDIYALGITIRFLFSASIVQYVAGIKGDYGKYLFQQGVSNPRDYVSYLANFDETERQLLFRGWIKQLSPIYTDMLRIELPEVETAKKLTVIIKKMCSPDPTDRYQSIQPIIDALESL